MRFRKRLLVIMVGLCVFSLLLVYFTSTSGSARRVLGLRDNTEQRRQRLTVFSIVSSNTPPNQPNPNGGGSVFELSPAVIVVASSSSTSAPLPVVATENVFPSMEAQQNDPLVLSSSPPTSPRRAVSSVHPKPAYFDALEADHNGPRWVPQSPLIPGVLDNDPLLDAKMHSYDDFIREQLPEKYYVYGEEDEGGENDESEDNKRNKKLKGKAKREQKGKDDGRKQRSARDQKLRASWESAALDVMFPYCDPVHVPFRTAQDDPCRRFLRSVLERTASGATTSEVERGVAKFRNNNRRQRKEDDDDGSSSALLGQKEECWSESHFTNLWKNVTTPFDTLVPQVPLPHGWWIRHRARFPELHDPSQSASSTSDSGGFVDVHVRCDPMVQKFEQRTIKFLFTFSFWVPHFHTHEGGKDADNDAASCVKVEGLHEFSALMKVPQKLFPVEPFSEVAAFEFDRKLRLHRIPPTTIAAVPAFWVKSLSLRRSRSTMPMVQEFLEASNVRSYDEWIDSDFLSFVQHEKSHRFGFVQSGGGIGRGALRKEKEGEVEEEAGQTGWEQQLLSHCPQGVAVPMAYVSLQVFMLETAPVLSSPLHVPYSKQHPGWHRWFDLDFHEYEVPKGPQLALAELAVFDALLMNDDRSPNKNNFVVGGCSKCRAGSGRPTGPLGPTEKPKWFLNERRPSGMPPTFVHLDHGMSFAGVSYVKHNPLAKDKRKVRFCTFYRPQMNIIEHLDRHDPVIASVSSSSSLVSVDERRERGWRTFFSTGIDAVVLRGLGKDRVEDAGSMMVKKVLTRLKFCLSNYTQSRVLQP